MRALLIRHYISPTKGESLRYLLRGYKLEMNSDGEKN